MTKKDQYRIIYSTQRERYKIQYSYKVFFWTYWADMDQKEYTSKEEAREELKSLKANDWEEVK